MLLNQHSIGTHKHNPPRVLSPALALALMLTWVYAHLGGAKRPPALAEGLPLPTASPTSPAPSWPIATTTLLPGLTGLEARVLDGICHGYTTRTIAKSLKKTETAIKSVIQVLFRKLLGAEVPRTRAELALEVGRRRSASGEILRLRNVRELVDAVRAGEEGE
jgi:DNA-binding NarL/FixJ family response regulator